MKNLTLTLMGIVLLTLKPIKGEEKKLSIEKAKEICIQKINLILDGMIGDAPQCVGGKGITKKTAKYDDWLPGYMIKVDDARIIYAEKVKDYIKKNALQYVDVPNKISIPISDEKIEEMKPIFIPKQFCLAEKIEDDESAVINTMQMKELIKLVTDVGYVDIKRNNFCINENKVYIIDTEPQSFFCSDKKLALRNLYNLKKQTEESKELVRSHYLELFKEDIN